MRRCLLVLLLLCLVQTPSYAILTLEYEDAFKGIELINVEVQVEARLHGEEAHRDPESLYDREDFKYYLESLMMFDLEANISKMNMPRDIRLELNLDLKKEVTADLIGQGRFDDEGNWYGKKDVPLDKLLDKITQLGSLLLNVSLEKTSTGQNYAVVTLQLYRGASLMLSEEAEKGRPIVLDALVWNHRSVLIEGETPLHKEIADAIGRMTFIFAWEFKVFAYGFEERHPELIAP
ncbi:MAG TPA: hypothetical protein DDZ91_07190, partial [Firmicutes bacterium]|nr:hypothetical protein [Bacillota bacterium]